MLIAGGANPDWPDEEGLTPLMRAAWNGHADVVAALLKADADAALTDAQGRTAMNYAKRAGNGGIIQLLRNANRRS